MEYKALVEALIERKRTFSCAESCTGGLIAKSVVDIAGASEIFMGGAVVYSNFAKNALIGVDKDIIEEKGAVSEEVACLMAKGVREKLKTDIAVSTTGIAGPGGGSAEKPVGTVYIGISSPLGTFAKRCFFPDLKRDGVRARSAETAADMVYEELLRL